MVILTSSHKVHLTDRLCEYVQLALGEHFGRFGEHVVSVDARLEAIGGCRDRHGTKAIIRVDRQLSYSRQINGQHPLEKFHARGRYTAANI